MSNGLLSTGDVARRLGWSIPKVRTLCETGRLPAINTSTGARPRWHVRECDLERFLTPASQRQTVAKPAPRPKRQRRINADVPKIF